MNMGRDEVGRTEPRKSLAGRYSGYPSERDGLCLFLSMQQINGLNLQYVSRERGRIKTSAVL